MPKWLFTFPELSRILTEIMLLQEIANNKYPMDNLQKQGAFIIAHSAANASKKAGETSRLLFCWGMSYTRAPNLIKMQFPTVFF